MLPTMTNFEQSLRMPKSHFKRLHSATPVQREGRPIIWRTHCAIETEIEWNSRHYLLMLPFRKEHLRHIEEVEQEATRRSRGPIAESRIMHDEVTLTSSLGRNESFPIILQDISYGIPLHEATQHYKSEELRSAVYRMKEHLDRVGFLHNNLTPSNILIYPNGVARPLRYWYAEWRDFCDNDLQKAFDLIEQNKGIGTHCLGGGEGEYEEQDIECEGIRRVRRQSRYGFIDSDGYHIAPYIYSSATHFCEGRAIVGKNNKFGAINNEGAKVVRVAYKSLTFDIKTGQFTAITDRFRYTLDYNGNTIRREEL